MDEDDDIYRKAPSNRASGSPTHGVPARRTSSELQFKARLTMPEAIEAVSQMLNAFPNARDGIRDGYIGVLAQLLTRYPKAIALRCAHPIVKWLEREQATLKTAAAWDQRSRDQLAERQRLERADKEESAEHRQAVADRIRAELTAVGFQFKQDKSTKEQIEAWRDEFMAKYNISQEQYDAIPDQPESSDYWQGVRWPES